MTDWLPQREPTGDGVTQLFCLPHVGGGVANYHRWERLLPATIEVLPIKLPGRESRFKVPPISDMQQMVRELAAEVVPQMRPPFALFGHSMGALIAFELAKHLRAHDRDPTLLVVSACRSPDRFTNDGDCHRLPQDDMIQSLVDDYGRSGQATPDELQMMRLMSDTIRADLKLLETYEYRASPPLSCRLIAIAATEDHQVTRSDVNAWRSHTTGSFTMRTLPGHHFFLKEQETAVCELLKAKIPLAQ